MAHAGLVVVDIAGGEDRHLARGILSGLHGERFTFLKRRTKFPGRILRQLAVLVHAQRAVQDAPEGLALVQRVHRLHHHRNGAELAHRVGGRQHPVAETDFALAKLDRLGTQHQVREVHVPGMWRHVGAFCHVAGVAQVALVDHLPVVLPGDAVDLHRLGGVHQVEQRRKRGAQVHAAPAAVADVEYALHLGKRGALVVEGLVFPVERVAGGGFEIAFAHGPRLRPPRRLINRISLVPR